jgi:uncharacterized metal-binding protein
MPEGKLHERFNLLLGGAFALAGTTLGLDWNHPFWSGAAAGYLVGTLLVTPDVDHYPRYRTRPVQGWGRLGFVWVFYGLLFRHRGLSHNWLLGPLTRVVYLSPLLLLLGLLLERLGLTPPLGALWGGLAGYYLSQWLHLWLDGIPLRLERL